MKGVLLQLWGSIPVSVLLRQGVPADVAPPPGQVAALAVGVLIVLGLLVAVVVIVSFLVIRAIRKKHTPKDNV